MAKQNPLPPFYDLQYLFMYDMDSGELRWRNRPSIRSRRRAGDLAGSQHHSGYLQVGIGKVIYMAHRLIWKLETGQDPWCEIDHRNGVRDDNRWLNIRPATRSEQNMNKSTPNYHRGVHFISASRKFGAQIKANGEHIWLGCHETPEQACAAYREAAARLHGEFVKPGRCSCL